VGGDCGGSDLRNSLCNSCPAVRRKDLIGDPRFDIAAARLKQKPEVDALIAASGAPLTILLATPGI
jgi:hypothetical protein